MKLKRNRMLSLLLTLVMVFGAVAVGLPGLVTIAHADTWSGTLSDPGSEYVVSGNTVHLYSARALVWFLNRIYNGTSFSGQTVYLDVDVDLNNVNLASSVFPYSDSKYFEGTFDGQNHTISNFTMSDSNHRVAMFRQTRNATFKNLNFTNVSITSSGDYSGHAVLVGYHNSGSLTFENIHVQSGSISGYRWMGALAGEIAANSSGNRLTMTNCSNGATITGRNARIGGLAGSSWPAVYATNCSNTGTVKSTGSVEVGGIVGWIEDDPSTFSGCTNDGSVQGTDKVGGIVGYFGSKSQDQKLTLLNNTNTGDVTATSGWAGGIAGHIDSDNNAHIFTGNVNRGKITAGSDAGGIVAYNAGFGTWTDNVNYGEVYAPDNAGGILGEVEDDAQTFADCKNYGFVHGGNSIGGICGYGHGGTAAYTNCYNMGNISAESSGGYAGGIHGHGTNEVQCTECFNTGTILSVRDAGGLVGNVDYHTFFTRCWNGGDVGPYSGNGAGYSYGGLVGYTSYYGSNTSQTMVVDCYNWGTISGGYTGGLVGYVKEQKGYVITYSYNTGTLNGTNSSNPFVAYGGTVGTGCYKNSSSGGGTYKSDLEFIDYNFTIDNNFKKNENGVTVNGHTFYFPILGWCESLLQTIPGNCYHAESWTAYYNETDGLYYTCDSCGERMDSECPVTPVSMTALPTAMGSTLQDDVIYRVASSQTVSGSDSQNGLKVAENATVVIYIPAGVTLTVNGGAGGNGSTTGKAGILVPVSATLIIAGEGTLKVTGGNGGNGANGNPGTASQGTGTGDGGAGGAGGAGGGAGIGGDGGNGGAGGAGSNYAGSNGSGGGDGSSCGKIYVLNSMQYTPAAGSAGTAGSGGAVGGNDGGGGGGGGAEGGGSGNGASSPKYSGGSGGSKGSQGGCRDSATNVSPDDARVENLIARFAFLNKQDGLNDPDIVKVALYTAMPAITAPTRTGYDFQGYYSAKNGGGTKYYNANGTSAHAADFNTGELYAHWTLHQYSISYTMNGGTASPANPTTYTILSGAITLTNPTRNGYTFKGWSGTGLTGDTNLTVTIPTGSTGDRSYTANWTPIEYPITYDLDGGTASNPATYTIETPTFTLNQPAKADYYFTGWSGTGLTGSANMTVTIAQGSTGERSYTAHWKKIAADDTFVLDYGLPVKLAVLDNDAGTATLKSVTASDERFTATVSGSEILFTPVKMLDAAVTFTYTMTYGGADYDATVTVIPANNVYYEESESFISFAPTEGTPAWQTVGTAFTGKFQNGLRPGDEDSPVYGFDEAYHDTNEATYSLGSAKYVTVKAGQTGATATFTFSGTGFDLYSLTDNESGAAIVTIYKVVNGTETKLETRMVNTYFGYKYGRLYLDGDKITLTQMATPVYYAPAGQTDNTFFVQGMTRGQTAPTYYDTNGTIVAGTAADESKIAYAYGWVAGSNNAVNGVYQVPVISRTGLDYGTYKVVVEPRYSARQDLTGNGEYKFYVDAVRIYDPIDPATISGAAYDAYQADGELNASYQEVRDLLIEAGSFGSTDGHGTAGVAFLEAGTSETLQDYAAIGPKNEVYLAKGQAIAFNLTTASAVTPAKVSVGLKMANGTSGSVTVYAGSKNVPLTINGATELYREITSALSWQQTTGGVYETASPIIIANTSDADCIISITKVKWSYDQAVPANGRALQFSFAPQDLVTAKAALQQASAQTVAPDASRVQLQWNTRMIRRGGTATLVITAPATFEKAYVNGKEIAGYTENADGTRSWSYDYTGSGVGAHAFDVKLTDANGYSTRAINAGSVEVVASTNGQGTLTLQTLLEMIFGNFFRALRALFRR